MTKQFLVTVETPGEVPAERLELVRSEIEQHAKACVEFYAGIKPGRVECQPPNSLRFQIALSASPADVDSILRDNISAFERGEKVHDRASARWEFADRVLREGGAR